jgi:hypothetical protein
MKQYWKQEQRVACLKVYLWFLLVVNKLIYKRLVHFQQLWNCHIPESPDNNKPSSSQWNINNNRCEFWQILNKSYKGFIAVQPSDILTLHLRWRYCGHSLKLDFFFKFIFSGICNQSFWSLRLVNLVHYCCVVSTIK